MRLTICLAAVLLLPTLTQAQTSAIEPCSLLTKEDASAALGEAVSKPGTATKVPGGAMACEYEGSGLHSVHLNVIPFDGSQAAVYRSLCAQKSKDGLTGLGDVTCWYNDKHAELQVLKGSVFFSIELHRSGDPTEPIKTVARHVYERLK
jgi:hypothetical protein